MPNTRHLLAQLEGCGALFLAGQLTNTLGVLTATLLSPPGSFDGDIAASRSAVGIYSLAVSNFRGPLGTAIPVASATLATTGTAPNVQIQANSYSGDTLTLIFNVRTSSGGLSIDNSVNFMVLAF